MDHRMRMSSRRWGICCLVVLGALLSSSLAYSEPKWCALVKDPDAKYPEVTADGLMVTTKIGQPVLAIVGGTVTSIGDGSTSTPWAFCTQTMDQAKEVTITHDSMVFRYGMLLRLADDIYVGKKIPRGMAIGVAGVKSLCVEGAASDEGIILVDSNMDLKGLATADACDCVPNCANRFCGDDGCGNSCGSCPAQTYCKSGQCECQKISVGEQANCGGDGCGFPLKSDSFLCPGDPNTLSCQHNICVSVKGCTPRCVLNGKEERRCGNDGCGGSCGECGPDYVCEAYQCKPIPKCEGRACGDDGHGGSCGKCSVGTCDASGQCVCEVNGEILRSDCRDTSLNEQPCGAVCYTGPIEMPDSGDGGSGNAGSGDNGDSNGSHGLASCTIDCTDKKCGASNGCGGICGQCDEGSCQQQGSHYTCVTLEDTCEPSCEAAQCGDDGCGGVCGLCGEGFSCDRGICYYGHMPEVEIVGLGGCQIGGKRSRSFGGMLMAVLGVLGGLVIRRKTIMRRSTTHGGQF